MLQHTFAIPIAYALAMVGSCYSILLLYPLHHNSYHIFTLLLWYLGTFVLELLQIFFRSPFFPIGFVRPRCGAEQRSDTTRGGEDGVICLYTCVKLSFSIDIRIN